MNLFFVAYLHAKSGETQHGGIKQANNLKLTVNGNLPIRICELLCSQNLIYWPYMKFVKRIREEEIPYLWIASTTVDNVKLHTVKKGDKRNNHIFALNNRNSTTTNNRNSTTTNNRNNTTTNNRNNHNKK